MGMFKGYKVITSQERRYKSIEKMKVVYNEYVRNMQSGKSND